MKTVISQQVETVQDCMTRRKKDENGFVGNVVGRNIVIKHQASPEVDCNHDRCHRFINVLPDIDCDHNTLFPKTQFGL